MTRPRPILIASGAAVLVALLGGLASQPGAWYAALNKSTLTPPDWVFAPAWTLIYVSCVIAAVIGWRAATTASGRAGLIWLFAINGALNVFWSALFFAMQRPDWALFEVVGLWLSVAALIVYLRPLSGRAALILVPYLVWVSFAAYLNYEVVALNPAFG
ncbi:MAG: TspO/MBR family protein [Pseudomonadota bacterium]